ncbi:MAG: hypothetical protein LBJ14_04020 [Desulfarculales bacterium]|jgi:TolB-like protein|nr:hypothetical protein [Desulfarculales bacterium]
MPSVAAGKFLIALLMLTALGLTAAPVCQAAQRVAIVPFTANAKEDISYMVRGVRDMLASRLAWQDQVVVVETAMVDRAVSANPGPYSDDQARQLGKSLNVDVVVFGSVTMLGQNISVDARVVKTADNNPAYTSYLIAEDIDHVLPKINDFTVAINRDIFNRQDSSLSAGQDQPAAASNDPVENLPESMSPLNPMFLRTLSGVESDRYWRSPRIDESIASVDVGDVDGNGLNELVVLTAHSVRIYRLNNETFSLAYEFKNGPGGTYMFVDIIDIKGTGIPQIVITNRNFRTMNSFFLEWQGSSFVMTDHDLPYYFRAQINPSGPGKILLAQKTAVNEPFWGPIYQMIYQNGELAVEKSIPVPRQGGYIYSIALADLDGNGIPKLVMIGLDFTLRVLSIDANNELWRSGDTFGGTPKFIDFAAGQGSTDSDPTRWWIAGRMVPFRMDESGRQEILIVRNDDRSGGFLERTRAFYQGTVLALYWNGMGMLEHWRTPLMSGSINDQAIADVGNIGRQALVMVSGQRSLAGLGEAESGNVVAFTLKPRTALPKEIINRGL